jgi:hypothetical protein
MLKGCGDFAALQGLNRCAERGKRCAGTAARTRFMIRFLLRFIGLLLLALAFVFVIYDGMKSIADKGLVFTRIGQFWIDIHTASLQLARAAVERNVGADVWRMAVQPILDQPASAVFGLIGIAFILLGRKKKPLIGYARD